MNGIYDWMKEIFISIGTDLIKETYSDNYDATKVHEELEQYIERERVRFENIDMQCEIDFYNLENYFKNYFLGDFKESLCGNSTQRSVKKKGILVKLYQCLGAESDERKKQYINSIFNQIYDIVGNYYERKVSVEQKYIMSKDQDEIINIVVKYNEELKRDNKEIKNVIEQLSNNSKQQVQTIDLRNTDMIYQYDIKKFIKKRYQNWEDLEQKYGKYSNFFKMFVEVTEEENGKINVDNLFEFVKERINGNVVENFIKICGPDGTGKSSFLMLLYQYLYECFLREEINVYPYYIDLHYYEWQVVEVTDKEELRREAEKYIREDLKAVAELGKNGVGLLFLIDGNDNYFRTDLKPGPILEAVLKDVKEENIKIICVGEKANVQPRRRRKANQFIERLTSYTFRFSPVYISEQDKYKKIIEQYCELEWKKGKQVGIHDCIRKFNIKEIDYNLLTIFQKCLEHVSLENITSLNGLYNRYCMICLDGDDDRLKVCEQMAYTYFITNEWIGQEVIAKYKEEWELVHQHKSISNYLLASYYADIILKCDETRQNQLESVFTNGINVFLKSIINEDVKSQVDALKGCKFMFDKGEMLAKAQAAYILGRIENKKLMNEAKKILKEQKELLRKDSKTSMDYFVLRTIYVSLLYLGESDAGEEFLTTLFKIPIMNEVNRAFYLQYYDDIKQQTENLNGENINLKDNGEEPITNTSNVLLNYVEKQLGVEAQNWSRKDSINFEIHLFTLCSLLQIRIQKESMKGILNKLCLIISQTVEQENSNISDDMKIYLKMFYDDIENKNYVSGHIYDELYGVKDIERSGWCKKIKGGSVNVVKYENVAEHMYYAWLMGMLYLPETAPEGNRYRAYQKEEILRCLLIHDLAEIYIGDKLSEEKKQQDKIEENEWMNKIFMHDTYNEIASMDAYRSIWGHFNSEPNNINSIIAKEIDIIQSIYQFYVYKEMGAEFLDNREEEWKKEKNKIRTEIGKKILKEVVLNKYNV